MKTLLLILISFSLNAQTFLQKNDLAIDYYSRGLFVGFTSHFLNKVTKKPILSGVIGLGLGYASCYLERGINGKIVSSMGATSGMFGYAIYNDSKKRQLEKIYKYKRLLE